MTGRPAANSAGGSPSPTSCRRFFGRVFASLESLPPTATLGDFRTRLHHCARWLILELARHSDRHPGESAAGRPISRVAEHSGDTTGPVTHDDDKAWLQGLLDQLDPKAASIIRERMAGRTFPEIAAALGEREETVRKRYVRCARPSAASAAAAPTDLKRGMRERRSPSSATSAAAAAPTDAPPLSHLLQAPEKRHDVANFLDAGEVLLHPWMIGMPSSGIPVRGGDQTVPAA